MKNTVFLLLAFAFTMPFFSGCALIGLTPGPSVCDDLEEPSRLCDMAKAQGVRLEDVGNVLIVANAVAIGAGTYTSEQAVDVLSKLLEILEDPDATYRYFRSELERYLSPSQYPGILVVADIYIRQFTMPELIFPKDKEFMSSFIKSQIEMLSP